MPSIFRVPFSLCRYRMDAPSPHEVHSFTCVVFILIIIIVFGLVQSNTCMSLFGFTHIDMQEMSGGRPKNLIAFC